MKKMSKIEISVNSVSEHEMNLSGVYRGEFGPLWWVVIAISLGEHVILGLFIRAEKDGPSYMYNPSTTIERGYLFTEEDIKIIIKEVFDNEYYKMINLLEEVSK